MDIVIPRAFKESNFRGRSIYNCMRNKKTHKSFAKSSWRLFCSNVGYHICINFLYIYYACIKCGMGKGGLGTGHTVSDDLTCCFIMTFICYHFFKFWSMAFFFFVSDYNISVPAYEMKRNVELHVASSNQYQHFYKNFVSIIIKLERHCICMKTYHHKINAISWRQL